MTKQTIYICSAPGRDPDALTLLRAELEPRYYLRQPLPLLRPFSAVHRRTVQQYLRGVDLVIFVLSRQAYVSPECTEVLRLAIKRHVPIIPLRWADDGSGKLESLIDVGAWESSETSTQISAAQDLRKHINTLNWVSFHEYRLITDSAEQERKRRVLVRTLLRTIENPIPTWMAFLSYARENASKDDFVPIFKNSLEELGEVWLDTEAIPPAKDWQSEIYRGIEQSHNVVCVVSIPWLTSPNCHREYLHARKNNKRLIPVVLEPFTEAAARTHLKNDPWDNLDDDAALETAHVTWEQLQTLPDAPITADRALLDPLISSLDARFNADSAYINEHTSYLVRAAKGEYLTMPELPGYWLWQRRSRAQRYPASDAHRAFFFRSMGRIARTAAVIILLLIIGLSVIASTLANARADTEAARADAETSRRQIVEVQVAETERRLQIQASYNNRLEIDLPAQPVQSAFAFDALWVSESTIGVMRVPLNGLTDTQRIETGGDPGLPVSGNGYLWLVGGGDGTLTRIDPASRTSRTVAIGTDPQVPLFTPGRVWVHALLDGVLVALDTDSLEEIERHRIGLNTSEVLNSGDALWYAESAEAAIIRIDALTGEANTFALPSEPLQLLYETRSAQVVIVLEDTLLTLDSRTGETMQQVALTSPIDAITAYGNALWARRRHGEGFTRFLAQTLEAAQVDLSGTAALHFTDNRIWAVTDETLVVFDAETLAPIRIIDTIEDPRRLSAPVSDGVNAWFMQTERGTVFVIDEQTGAVLRDLQPCADPSALHFDGANMWFVCPSDQQVIALPADLTFFGEQSVLNDAWTQSPLLIGDTLWTIQYGTGRISAYDLATGVQRAALDLGSTALPALYSDPYLWTALPNTGDLIRINTRQLETLTAAHRVLTYDAVPLGAGISNINLFEDVLWVQRLDINADQGFLTLLDADTLMILKRDDTLKAFGGLYYDDGVVWTSTFDINQGYIVKLDPHTGEILLREPMPVTPFASVAPLRVDDLLWFTAVMPPPALTMTVGMELLSNRPRSEEYPFYLLGLDPETLEPIHAYPLNTWTGTPEYDDGYFWYRQAAPVVVDNLPPATGNGVIAVSLSDGDIPAVWSVCPLDSGFALEGDFMWLGCMGEDDTFGVFRRDQTEPHALYNAVGVYPQNPVQIGNCLVFTFEDSATAAIFDVTNGDLLRTYHVGSRPLAPVVYGDRVYIYNSGSDTLQRLNVRVGTDNNC